MLTDSFFNKSRFLVTPLTDQVNIAPAVLFSIPTSITDMLKFIPVTTVTAVLQKVAGRDITTLPAVVTVTGTYTFSATPALIDWDGKTSLQLRVTINSVNFVNLPLVIKG